MTVTKEYILGLAAGIIKNNDIILEIAITEIKNGKSYNLVDNHDINILNICDIVETRYCKEFVRTKYYIAQQMVNAVNSRLESSNYYIEQQEAMIHH